MRGRVSLKLCVLAVAIAAISAACFLGQGGFGAGHGDLDRVIFVLALPWAMIPWPDFVLARDIVWLVLLPPFLNVATIAVVTAVTRGLKRRRLLHP
jgi:hypothetical protein